MNTIIISLTNLMWQFETYHWPGSPSAHGTDGPIHISEGPFGPTKLQGQFIKAPARVGFPESVDLQNLDSNQAVQRTLRFVSSDGIRQDAAHAYLQPRFQNGNDRNLFVLVEHEVVRVMVEDTRVAGIEVRSNPVFQNSTQDHKIKASKMVVVSAGTLGTSMLLEQSGVGDRNVLSLAGVNVVVELPGVGMGLQDHNTMLVSYYSSLGSDETYDDILDGKTMYQKLLEQKSRMLIWNTAETTSKVRPTNKEIESLLGLPALKL